MKSIIKLNGATIKISFLLLTATAFHLESAIAGDDTTSEFIKATQLTASVFLLEGAGGNITALIGQEGVLLVDDDFASMAEKLLHKIKELKGSSPRFIVNTHFHYDHSGGNEAFGPTAAIIAATAVRDRLMSEQTLWKKPHPPVQSQALPILTFDQSLKIHLNKEEVRIVHYPRGHTDGDSVVFFKHNNIVSMGDLYFSGMYPIFHPEHGGSIEGYAQNIRKVLDQTPENSKIVPGHGPLSGKGELEKYHRMILASIAIVRKELKTGRSLEQIQKQGLPQEWETYSHGYLSTDKWLALLYHDLSRDKSIPSAPAQ